MFWIFWILYLPKMNFISSGLLLYLSLCIKIRHLSKDSRIYRGQGKNHENYTNYIKDDIDGSTSLNKDFYLCYFQHNEFLFSNSDNLYQLSIQFDLVKMEHLDPKQENCKIFLCTDN